MFLKLKTKKKLLNTVSRKHNVAFSINSKNDQRKRLIKMLSVKYS